jgi:hypothetical protein
MLRLAFTGSPAGPMPMSGSQTILPAISLPSALNAFRRLVRRSVFASAALLIVVTTKTTRTPDGVSHT